MKTNMRRVKKQIADAADISVPELEEVFKAVAAEDVRFASAFYGEGAADTLKAVGIMSGVERVLYAQLKVTQMQFKNLSQTTIVSNPYRKAVDVAVRAVQSGVSDYHSAIRRAVRDAGHQGIQIQYPSGAKRRLDTAVRQNVLDGVRAVQQEVLNGIGDELGMDGVEISAHMLCAEDHLPYQGRQYSKKQFEDIQGLLYRKFGTWNCRHTMYPIVLGVSKPAYSEEELKKYEAYSREQVEINGRTMSRYEWSQEMRRIETATRRERDTQILAKSSGNDIQQKQAAAREIALKRYYTDISSASGLKVDYSRMYVQGHKIVNTNVFTSNVKDGKITIDGKELSARYKEQKEQEHIAGTKRCIERLNSTGKMHSVFYENVDVKAICTPFFGSGKIATNAGGSISSYFNAGTYVGFVYDLGTGEYKPTKRVCIRYSKDGWHAFPVKNKGDD